MSDFSDIRISALDAVEKSISLKMLEDARVALLGKSGSITAELKKMGALPPEQRKEFGQAVNSLKEEIAAALDAKKATMEETELSARLTSETLDITLAPRPETQGSIHPVTQVIEEMTAIFGAMGFSVAEGPEIEDDFHNFTALNIPANHPARQMHDTFYFPEKPDGTRNLLRTHTSPVQIRWMQHHQPPYRFIAPGRVYRCDSDMTHAPMFHQIEALVIDKSITMAHLKGCLTQMVRSFFGVEDVPLRFRPSFFPFTEPSAEVDIGCSWENGELKIGAGKSWLEIGGCGMVHPNVLKAVNLDPAQWQGFAFGMGIERMAMLKYGIPDVRPFFESDARWLAHYSFAPFDIPSLVGGLAR